MGGLTVAVDERRSAMVVRLSGSAGMTSADDLDKAVRMIKVRRPRSLVIDLAGLTFIASIGLSLLLSLQAALKIDGGSLRIAGASPNIAEVVRRCRLDRILPLYTSVDEAMQGFSAGPNHAGGGAESASDAPTGSPA